MLRKTWRWRVLAAIVIVLVRTLRWRVDVRGLDNVPRASGAILTFNHHSYLDFVMVAWAVYLQADRPVRFLAKREIWQSRWTGWIVRFAEAVPVDRGSSQGRTSAFTAAAEALRSGDLIGMAPEQTISPSYELLPFRTGAVRMAQMSGAPIVPVIGWGTQRAFPKDNPIRFRRRIAVVVEYGEPFLVGPDDDVVERTNQLQERMTTMLHRVQDTYPDRPRAGESPFWLPARLGGTAPDHAEVLAEHRRRARRWGESDPTSGDAA